MTRIVDNFLPEDTFKTITDVLLGVDFPWYYYFYVNTRYEQSEHIQFTHGFYHYLHENPWNSPYCDLIAPIMDNFEWQEILRVKANLIPKTSSHIVSGYHVDDNFPHNVAIFYLNTNNGFTSFENGDTIDCVNNRMLFFDGVTKHSSVTCTDKNVRVVLNINYR